MQHICSPPRGSVLFPCCFCCPVEQVYETQKDPN
ncbi:hypothetical protein CABS03_07666 [Colletotrichum abscissum]|uniref:Uncharacterized protein n=2 Tax=Colletotrichum acutatum species complex TaxID=2707335 RepID=A0A9Q0B5X4_9PEZI|nr:hypothetical protein CABS02_05220 [Colletotrichum abscissum]